MKALVHPTIVEIDRKGGGQFGETEILEALIAHEALDAIQKPARQIRSLGVSVNRVKAFEDHTHWSAVKEVCRRLRESGYQALLAGGSVRDMLMSREPNDFDVATDATPDQVEALFPRAVAVGKAFGVIVLPQDGFEIEVATFREDLEYRDGRRPEGVKCAPAEADAKRRDFTVNALFLDPESGKIHDYVGGQKDLAAKILRTVGEPFRRFTEDKLRLLRAVRFVVQLGFELEAETHAALIRMAPEISVVSRERIRDEIEKLLRSPNRLKGLSLLLSTGLLSAALPESAPFIWGEKTEWLKRFEALGDEPISMPTLLALFFLPVWNKTGEKDFRDRHLKSLKLDNHLMETIVFSLRHAKDFLSPAKLRRGELAVLLRHRDAVSGLELATKLANTPAGDASPWECDPDRTNWIESVKTEAAKTREFYLTGEDLKRAGIAAGPWMGALLKEAQMLQLEGSFTSREAALAWLELQKKSE